MRNLLGTAGVIGALGLFVAPGCGKVNASADAGGGDDVVDSSVGQPDADRSPDAMPPDPCTGNVAEEDFWGCLQADACALVNGCISAFLSDADCLEAPLFLFGDMPGQVGELLYADSVARGAITYDPAAAGACLDMLQSFECAELFGSSADPVQDCTVYTGVRTPGQGCFHDDECAVRGSQCRAIGGGSCNEACCPGNCVSPIALNADCTADSNCVPGAHCVQQAGAGRRCESGELGATCTGDFNCDPEFFCNGGTCAADFSTNATCADDDQCPVIESCVGDNLQGGTGMGTCGRIDRENDPCDGSCTGVLWCDQPDPTALGVCRTLPALNESCAASGRCQAFFQLECDATSELCVVRGTGVGTGCADSQDCAWPNFCNTDVTGNPTGICIAPQSDGASCTDTEQCQTQLCIGNPGRTCQAFTSCI